MENILNDPNNPEQIWEKETLAAEYGKVVFQPLERGFGVTVGNAIRRVLLSSIEGDAVTSVKIDGVLHETSSIKGVAEDTFDIIMNLKSMVVRSQTEEVQTLVLDSEKEGVIKAGDFEPNSMVEVCNPDLVIATLSPGAHLQMEITVGRGRGYVPAEEHKPERQIIGVIPIDAIYSPVRRVKYLVEDTRVGQRTDFEKLTMEIWTNGSVRPEEALKKAASILIKHFNVFAQQEIQAPQLEPVEGEEGVVEQVAVPRGPLDPRLDKNIDELELSVRAYNCLKAANLKTIRELIIFKEDELLKFRNFGKKSLNEIKEILEKMELSLGMKIIGGKPIKQDNDDEEDFDK